MQKLVECIWDNRGIVGLHLDRRLGQVRPNRRGPSSLGTREAQISAESQLQR